MTDQQWHLDKRVPIALILAIIIQVAGAVYWASKMEARIDANTSRIEVVDRDMTRLSRQITSMADASNIQAVQMGRIEEQISGMRGDVSRLIAAIERNGR